MENAEKELLEQHGFDVEGTMKRFLNNEDLYKKCLKKFLADQSMEKLKIAFDTGDVNEAFKAAHTMKGFISNLGMDRLCNMLNPMVEKLRNGSNITKEELDSFEIVYNQMYELIENI